MDSMTSSSHLDAFAFICRHPLGCSFCHGLEGGAGEAVGGPVALGSGAEGEVEVYARLVPVEAGPIEAAAAALERRARQMAQQRPSIAVAALLRLHEEVLQIDAAAAQEG